MSKRAGYTKYSKLKSDKEITRGEVQNRSSARVYIFGNDTTDDISIDDDYEMSEVRSRGKSTSTSSLHSQDLKKSHVIEKEIHSDDTLQKFALNFGCTVSEYDLCLYLSS